MKDALQPLFSTRTVSFLLFAYGFPVAIGLGLWWLFLRPSWYQLTPVRLFSERLAQTNIADGWLFALSWGLLTIGLGLNAQFFFRLHEGYYLPSVISRSRSKTHYLFREHRRLRDLDVENGGTENLQAPTALSALRRKTLLPCIHPSLSPIGMLDSWQDYPVDNGDFMATKLGNRIRAFERYGNARFGLDIIILWYNFVNATGETLLAEMQAARERTEVFLAAAVVGELLALASLLPLIDETNRQQALTPALAISALSAVAAVIMYNRAVVEVDEWHRSTAAMVDSSRGAVAETFGFALPPVIEHEVYAWHIVTAFVRLGTREYGERLDQIRAKYPTITPS